MKLKTGTLSKEELVETLMGTTPLKQISKRIDVEWEDPVVPRYNGQRSQRVQCSPVPGVETEKARQSIAGQIELTATSCNGKAKEMPARNPCSICSRTSRLLSS